MPLTHTFSFDSHQSVATQGSHNSQDSWHLGPSLNAVYCSERIVELIPYATSTRMQVSLCVARSQVREMDGHAERRRQMDRGQRRHQGREKAREMDRSKERKGMEQRFGLIKGARTRQ